MCMIGSWAQKWNGAVCDADSHLICEKEKTNGSLVEQSVGSDCPVMNTLTLLTNHIIPWN